MSGILKRRTGILPVSIVLLSFPEKVGNRQDACPTDFGTGSMFRFGNLFRAHNKMPAAVGRVTPCAPWLVGFAARAKRRALPTAGHYSILLDALRQLL